MKNELIDKTEQKLSNAKITIILPVFNASQFIMSTLDSIFNQTYTNYELIIIDDCSTDNSLDIIKKRVNKKNNVKIIELSKNHGVSNARNTGLKNSTGEYIAFIDSDDIWKESKLKDQLNFMVENDIDFSFTSYELKFCDTQKANKRINVPSKITYNKLLKNNPIACFTVMVKRDRIKDSFFLDEKHEDYIMWLELSKKTNKMCGYNKSLGIYSKHSNSLSSNKLKSATWVWNIYRNIEKINFIKSVYLFVNYAINGIFKHLI